jgi:hypothetical protein
MNYIDLRYPYLNQNAFDKSINDYLIRIKAIEQKYPYLTFNLPARLLKTVLIELNPEHVNKLVVDIGHGLNHAFFVMELALALAEDLSKIDINLIVCGSLLHDVYAVMDRDQHEIFGSDISMRIIKSLNDDFASIDPVAIAYIVRTHNNREFSGPWKNEAEIVRDADTLHECLCMDRIVWIGLQKRTKFYNTNIYDNAIEYRLKVLQSDDRTITEGKECDILMFLLRNVTKYTSDMAFVTMSARKYYQQNYSFESNLNQIRKYIKIYISDPHEQVEATKLVNDIVSAFSHIHHIN